MNKFRKKLEWILITPRCSKVLERFLRNRKLRHTYNYDFTCKKVNTNLLWKYFLQFLNHLKIALDSRVWSNFRMKNFISQHFEATLKLENIFSLSIFWKIFWINQKIYFTPKIHWNCKKYSWSKIGVNLEYLWSYVFTWINFVLKVWYSYKIWRKFGVEDEKTKCNWTWGEMNWTIYF